MKRKLTLMTLLLVTLGLWGCAGTGGKREASAVPLTPKTLVASGYSRFDDSGRLAVNHRWLSAQQFAKLSAYRGLADQLYDEPVSENQTVGTQVINSEAHRIYLDAYLREARASDYRTVKDTLKTTLELTLTPRFYQCMGGDTAQVNQCLREDGKMPFTRLGYKKAATSTVNLACGSRDCSDQFFVQGFARDRNYVDDKLLDIGMYDTQWTINTGARMLFNYYITDAFLNAI